MCRSLTRFLSLIFGDLEDQKTNEREEEEEKNPKFDEEKGRNERSAGVLSPHDLSWSYIFLYSLLTIKNSPILQLLSYQLFSNIFRCRWAHISHIQQTSTGIAGNKKNLCRKIYDSAGKKVRRILWTVDLQRTKFHCIKNGQSCFSMLFQVNASGAQLIREGKNLTRTQKKKFSPELLSVAAQLCSTSPATFIFQLHGCKL